MRTRIAFLAFVVIVVVSVAGGAQPITIAVLRGPTALAALPRLNVRVESGSQSRSALEARFSVLEGFDPAAIGGSLPDHAF